MGDRWGTYGGGDGEHEALGAPRRGAASASTMCLIATVDGLETVHAIAKAPRVVEVVVFGVVVVLHVRLGHTAEKLEQ